MKPHRVMLVAGARPNFVKIAPVLRALERKGGFEAVIVHTGQHYDEEMSGSFFRTLELPPPDVNLEVGSASQSVQTARIMERFEPVVLERRPDAVVVFGDVNSTAACALVAAKLCVPLVHVEAGLRSFDRSMPEEVNRIVTDALSDLLLVTEPAATENLRREGKPPSSIREVGNVMIDSLEWVRRRIEALAPWTKYGLGRKGYGLVTLHRPSNVDEPRVLGSLLACLGRLARQIPLVFPAHPRTRKRIEAIGYRPTSNLHLDDPVPYAENIALQAGALVVLTDSGGMQEETSCLGVPCLTLRPVTERPITVERGTSTLVGSDPVRIEAEFARIMEGSYKQPQPIPLWDGRAAERVVEAMREYFSGLAD